MDSTTITTSTEDASRAAEVSSDAVEAVFAGALTLDDLSQVGAATAVKAADLLAVGRGGRTGGGVGGGPGGPGGARPAGGAGR